MIEAERRRLIRKLVDERYSIGLSDLVEILFVSEATVRRDIAAMAERARSLESAAAPPSCDAHGP